MSNVILQDVNAVIHGTSQHGLDYDIAHVTMLMKTDEPIPQDLKWGIPNIENISPVALELIKKGTIPIYPILKSKARSEMDDILQNVDSNNESEYTKDVERGYLLISMHEKSIESVDINNCLYVISYKYRLYPVEPNNFDFKVLLPFDGLNLCSSGGRLQITLVAPINATINPTITKGEDPINGQQFEETITKLESVNKNIVNFTVQQDPLFTIRYCYQS